MTEAQKRANKKYRELHKDEWREYNKNYTQRSRDANRDEYNKRMLELYHLKNDVRIEFKRLCRMMIV